MREKAEIFKSELPHPADKNTTIIAEFHE